MFKQMKVQTVTLRRHYISYAGYYMFIPLIPDTHAYWLSPDKYMLGEEYIDQETIDNSEQLDTMIEYAMDRKNSYAKWNLGNMLTGNAKIEEWIYYETV